MKKLGVLIGILLLSVSVFLLGFSSKPINSPNTYYGVYLDEELLGLVNSKDELENYIDEKGEKIKKDLSVDKVYSPNGLEIKKVTTYKGKVSSVANIYKKIAKKKSFTVKGYQFTIKEEVGKVKVYVLNKKTFEKALEKVIASFVGTDAYEAYKNNTQAPITTTGSTIENVYISNDITVKSVNIPVTEKIYIDELELSQYLLFGKDVQKKYYTVSANDTVETVAFNNQVSTEELLVSNPEIKSIKNLLYVGQQIAISYLDPQVKVIMEAHSVDDIESKYRVEEQYDSSRLVGDDLVTQKGENGLERITQNIKYENGVMVYVDPVSKEELKPTINEVVVRGKKIIPNVGSLTNWAWPTVSGYTITSNYAYRIHPIKKIRQLHPALDIAAGYGSPIFASNNGVVYSTSCDSSYGICAIINHNNGYYTLYGHMSRRIVKVGQVVSKGQRIGDMGMTGSATGPHLHYELWIGGPPWKGGTNINPHTVHG